MSTPAKRKRAKKACIPCHRRKRKCDNQYPCGMCATYDYDCRYDDSTGSASDVHASLSSPRRISPAGAQTNQTHVQQPPAAVEESLARSSTAVVGASTGIFDERKVRYVGASAAMAFPHVLGMALGSGSPPKMRSVAYNFGIRPEEVSDAHCALEKLISEEDLAFFSDVYFSVMAPIGDLLDPGIYAQRCHDYYHKPSNRAMAFSAAAAGIAALGSFLSPNRHPREPELVQYAKAILDDPVSMRMLSVDHIVAWGMRVLYLRATTRPNNAWVASCTVMHLCETVGLHMDENIKKMAAMAGAEALGLDEDRLRRIFWISWAGHVMLSYEQDRSAVQFRVVTCQPILSVPGSVADQFVQLIQIIPSQNSPFSLGCTASDSAGEFFGRLKELAKLQSAHPFLVVTKADIALCFYRRVYHLKTYIPDDFIDIVIDSGSAAITAAEQLASQGRLFWNTIGSVFQYACVLLAIDTPTAFVHLPTAFKALENLVTIADTLLTREALSIARHLLSLSMAQKRKHLAQLEAVEASYQLPPLSASQSTNPIPDMGWELDWDQFFTDPYLSMLGPDIQL